MENLESRKNQELPALQGLPSLNRCLLSLVRLRLRLLRLLRLPPPLPPLHLCWRRYRCQLSCSQTPALTFSDLARSVCLLLWGSKRRRP